MCVLHGGVASPAPRIHLIPIPIPPPQKALIDPTDESYEVQRAAADRVLPTVLMTLLEDDEAAVAVEAATCLAAVADHSGSAVDKVEAGHFAATPAKMSLNPVQEAVGEMEGVFG